MNQTEILFIGTGQAGNNAVNELKKINPKVHAFYINSAEGDLYGLENVKHKYLFSLTNGAGGDRTRVRDYMQSPEETYGLSAELRGFKRQKVCFIVTSTGGGSGSGSAIPLAGMLGKISPDMVVNLVLFLPFKKEGRSRFENTIEFWNELVALGIGTEESKMPNLHSIYVIDNSKRDSKEDINKEFAETFNSMLNFAEDNKDGSFDEADSEKFLLAYGICGIYNFQLPKTDLIEEIAEVMEDSIYVVKSKFFDNVGLKINETFDEEDEEVLFSEFRSRNDNLVVKTKSKDTTLILSGSKINNKIISSVSKMFEKKSKEIESFEEKEEDIKMATIDVPKKIIRPKKQTEERKAIDEILKNGTEDFWNSILK